LQAARPASLLLVLVLVLVVVVVVVVVGFFSLCFFAGASFRCFLFCCLASYRSQAVVVLPLLFRLRCVPLLLVFLLPSPLVVALVLFLLLC
jgi:hypothetical protein